MLKGLTAIRFGTFEQKSGNFSIEIHLGVEEHSNWSSISIRTTTISKAYDYPFRMKGTLREGTIMMKILQRIVPESKLSSEEKLKLLLSSQENLELVLKKDKKFEEMEDLYIEFLKSFEEHQEEKKTCKKKSIV